MADANALLGWFGVKGDEQAGGVAGGALMQNGAVRPHEAAAQEIADAIARIERQTRLQSTRCE